MNTPQDVEGVEQARGLFAQGGVAVVKNSTDGLGVHRPEELEDVQRAIVGRAHGDAVMQRIQLPTLTELQAGAALDPGTEPAEPLADRRAAA